MTGLVVAFSTFCSSFRSSEISKSASSALPQGFDTETPQGRFFLQVIGAVAEFERELIRERINDKLKVLKQKGVKLGRPMGSKDKKERKKADTISDTEIQRLLHLDYRKLYKNLPQETIKKR